jgi:peroxiredoxin Q/BCP
MQAFQKDLEKFDSLDAQVLGVSSDSLETHKKFSEKYKFTFPLISDEQNKIRYLYSWGRVTYLIDKKGIIRHLQKGVPDNKVFINRLSELEKELKKED